MRKPGRGGRGRARSRPGRPAARALRAARRELRPGGRGGRGQRRHLRRLRSHPGGSALLRSRHARLAARCPLAQVAGADRAPGRASRAGSSLARPERSTIAARSCTATCTDLGARERGPDRRPSWAPTRRCGPTTWGRAIRSSPRAATAASSRRGPTAIAPTGSSSPECAGAGARRGLSGCRPTGEGDASAAGLPGLRRALAAPDPAPGPLPVRLLPAALRAGLAVPQLRRASDDRPHEHLRGHALPALRQLDAASRLMETPPASRRAPGSAPSCSAAAGWRRRSCPPTSRGSARRWPR